jgi:transcriptional regulator with XRE-family HTH domain
MAKQRDTSIEISSNTFGKLVRSYREQRHWTQEELADRWGHTREYVSQVERGKRKLDRTDQVIRLADILEIPYERLAAIGRGLPQQALAAKNPQEADDALFQALLEPAQATVKLSWLVWYANSDTSIIDNLSRLAVKLEDAITNRRGALLKPAEQLLAYSHEMLGKFSFDRLDYTDASGHFQQMRELGEELNDPDIIALSLIRQGDMLRRRGRYEHTIRCLEAAKPFAEVGNVSTSGLLWQTFARAYAEYQQKDAFLRAIDQAEDAAHRMQPKQDRTNNQFTLIGVLQERGQGLTLLGEPQRALEIYRQSEHIQPFRPMRDQGILIIQKAQAYAYAGDIDKGVKYALRGLKLAREYHSKRHISRIQRMVDRLAVTPLGRLKEVEELREALRIEQMEQG